VNFPTAETPQALGSGQVDAIAAWYPILGRRPAVPSRARRRYSRARTCRASFTIPWRSNPTSLAEHREEWRKIVAVLVPHLELRSRPEDPADARRDHGR